MTRGQRLKASAALIRQLCEVPEALTVTQWADKYRMLPETSTAPGPYDSSVVPYARRPQDCMADPAVPMVVLCWASQLGKSTAIENAIGYRIHRMPSPIIVVQPKIDAAEAWTKERLVPMIRATPVLRERVKLGRTTESTLRYKAFPGGFCFVASAGSATELAARSSPVMDLDEVDRYEVIPGEGNPVEIALRRQGAADVATAVLTSTPRDAETTIIWPYLEAGTYEKYFVPCPHCGHRQELRWAQLDFETACYACESCGVLIEEKFKPAMLAAGEWRATNPEGQYPSFHLNALYSPFAKSGWAAMIAAWKRAQGKPADLQVFVNTFLAELWTESDDRFGTDQLLTRLETGHERGMVPEGVGALTLGVDVQADRIEWTVWGWGAGLESWLIDHGVIVGDPEREPSEPTSPWPQLQREVIDREFAHVGGGRLRIAAGLIDSGYATTKVYTAARAWSRLRVYPSKGVGGGGVPIVGKPNRLKNHSVLLIPIGTDGAKTEFLRSQLREPNVGPGFVHLPDWLETPYLDQLVAEVRKRRVHRGQVIYEWHKRGHDVRNEGLDCRVYARAALELLGVRYIRALGDLAKRVAVPTSSQDSPKVETPPPPPTYAQQQMQQRAQGRQPRRGGWVNGWKR
jgi:phage terminase large subunit GpA-like protein